MCASLAVQAIGGVRYSILLMLRVYHFIVGWTHSNNNVA